MGIDLATLPRIPEYKFDIGLWNFPCPTLRPFDQADGIGFACGIANTDKLKLARVLYPVQIEMKKCCLLKHIAFLKGKCRAFYPAGMPEGTNEAARERGLARAQVSAQVYD